MNNNEEYLDNLLKNMNHQEEETEPEDTAIMPKNPEPVSETPSNALTPEEIAALFDAAEKIAQGIDPDPLEDTPFVTAEQTVEDTPVMSMEPELTEMSKTEEVFPGQDEPVLEEVFPGQDETGPADSLSFREDSMNGESQEEDGQAAADDAGKKKKKRSLFGKKKKTKKEAASLTDTAFAEELPPVEELPPMAEMPSVEELPSMEEKSPMAEMPSVEELPTMKEMQPETETQHMDEPQADIMEMDLADVEGLFEDKSETDTKGKKDKKPGLFKRLFAFITEEEEDEEGKESGKESKKENKKEKKKSGNKKKGKGSPDISDANEEKDENREILEELDNEDQKAKKEQKKKNQKADKKAGKKEKPSKKNKKTETEQPEEKASKAFNTKNIILVSLFAAAIFAILYLGIVYVSPVYAKKNAVSAFERQDYLTCYEILYGQELTEREKQLFDFSYMVLKMQKKVTNFEKYKNDGQEMEAIDYLMQAVEEYDKSYERAVACGADGEMLGIYRNILNILQEEYGLEEDEVRKIAFCSDKVTYTRMLEKLVNGDVNALQEFPGFSDPDAVESTEPENATKDLLPEEEELTDTEFLP